MMPISFMSANFVARETGYTHHGDWGAADRTVQDYFSPLDTYAQRFGAMLDEIRAMGFDYMDVWVAHLNWSWATGEHIRLALELLKSHRLTPVSLAGWFGATAQEFEQACKLASALGIPVLGGSSSFVKTNRDGAVALLRQHGLKLGIENHPEKTPQEMLDQIGDGAGGLIGTTVDTGWYGTQSYDAARALQELGPHVVHVHLKNVEAPGEHDTTGYEGGIVPIEACVRVLQAQGYTGAISIEHEPFDHNPTEICKRALALLRGWLGSGTS